ncbi:MAG: SulP family inorganic anion transporter [Candidatus Promineifilaceae bacterium]
MLSAITDKTNLTQQFQSIGQYLQQPVHRFRQFNRSDLKPDLIAGLTVAVLLLPQAMAFALIAELPPEMGLYTAIVAGITAALWGSSNQMRTGPANAISLLVASTLSNFYMPGSPDFVMAAGLLAVMAGFFQMVMGMAKLGFLVNFVSHSVIIGFASGAGVLIGVKQLGSLLGLSGGGGGLVASLVYVFTHLNEIHVPTAEIGLLAMAVVIIVPKLRPSWPAPLMAMIAASAAVFFFNLTDQGVSVVGRLSMGLPAFQPLPLFNLEKISQLSTGALAVGAIGLVQVTAITRSIAAQTGQRLDSNQEFVGQGLANIASGLFGGYNCAGSFSVSAVNFKAGARTPFAAVFASLFVLVSVFILGPLTAFLPTAALSGVLVVIAYGMIDQAEIKRIWKAKGYDAFIMVVTLIGTLFLDLQFAVLIGIILSLASYIMKTSTPKVHAVLPDEHFRHFYLQPDKEECPQLGIIEILGDLYFGAVNHVEEFILNHAEAYPEQRFLLIRMHNVNHCDFSGVHMLESVVKSYRDKGGDVYLVRTNPRVREVMDLAQFCDYLTEENFLDEDTAVATLFYHKLDPAICIYECPFKVFKECQNLPKRVDLIDLPTFAAIPDDSILTVTAETLWQMLHHPDPGRRPHVIDVREPREYHRGHIPGAENIPLPTILQTDVKIPNDRDVILVCRSGRRSRRAAFALQRIGAMNVRVLENGMIAWENANLLEAVDLY